MEYITEVKAFYRLIEDKDLPTGAIALWHALIFLNNKCYWKESFDVSNQTLQLYTGLSRQAIQKNRNILKQIALIDFRTNGTKSTTYKLNTMSNNYQVSCQVGSQEVVKSVAQSNRHIDNRHKDNKTKREIYKEKNPQKPKKTPYGEYSHVLLTEEEHSKLYSEYANADELITYLDEYVEMKGYEVKSCYLAIKKWVVDAVAERKTKKTQNNHTQKQEKKLPPLNNFSGEVSDVGIADIPDLGNAFLK